MSTERLNPRLSKKIVEYLMKEMNLEVKEVAKYAKSTPSYIQGILDGEKAFRAKHMKALDESVPNLLPALGKDLFIDLVITASGKSKAFVSDLLAKHGGDKVDTLKDASKKASKKVMREVCSGLSHLLHMVKK